MSQNADSLNNAVLKRMRKGDVALGLNGRIVRSGDLVRIAKATDHDFVFIDSQHALYDLETIGHIANLGLALDVTTLVRVRSVNDPDVSLLLDSGVQGIVFPDVNTAAEARKAVETCRFAPLGKRSVGGGFVHFNFRGVPLNKALQELNDNCLIVCMIETPEGLANLEEIAAVPGIDVLHLGTNDLLVNMGLAGQFDHPDIVAAQDRLIEIAKKSGKFSGCGGNRDIARQAAIIRKGVQFVTTQADVAFMMSAAGQWSQSIRSAIM
jgi:2-keto-3-deoxy-L-rhamnonate aldolase RhmA